MDNEADFFNISNVKPGKEATKFGTHPIAPYCANMGKEIYYMEDIKMMAHSATPDEDVNMLKYS